MSKGLKETIDRLVAESIRRILPGIMNEVLLRAVANSVVIQETSSPPVRKKPGPKPKARQVQIREARAPELQTKRSKQRKGRAGLNDLLNSVRDPEAGSDYYTDPRALFSPDSQDINESVDVEVDDIDDAPVRQQKVSKAAARVNTLAPHLRGLAEGVQLDDDTEEMWEAGEHDSAPPVASAAPGEIRDVGRAASQVGVDFSRMKSIIGATAAPVARVSAQDRADKAQFEQNRLARIREQLNRPAGG